jgi:predicted ATPase
LHQALVQVFTDLSTVQPLLVIIEDVHWCDDASLEFLLFLARRFRELHLLLLLTYRDDEVNPVLADFLAHIDRERLTTEFRLPRLTAETVSMMLRAIFAMERLPRGEFVDAIHNLSEGNPFFIEEILKSLVAEGDIFLADGKWERKSSWDCCF